MMTGDDLKKYTPIVGTGSGCFLQPFTEEYTYILTSKHLFSDKRVTENGVEFIERTGEQIVPIKYYVKSGDRWIPHEFNLPLRLGETYFPHPNAQVDAAILKIQRLENFDRIIVQNESAARGFSLSGHPTNRRNDQETYTSYAVEREIASTNFGKTVQLNPGHAIQAHIEGMSGGGLMKPDTAAIVLAGIQSRMLSTILPAGQITYVPISYFSEIIAAYNATLEKLLPLYLKSFKYHQDEIFRLSYGLEEQEIAEALTTILKGQARNVIESDITPYEIRSYLKERLMLILPNQSNTELEKKKIWIAWLELMTILNIAYAQDHKTQHLPELLKNFRLFYSDIEQDFFLAHLDDLDKLDYTGLQKGGVVVVASNVVAKGRNHLLRPEKIPRIDSLRKKFQVEGIAIDDATDYPLDKYTFMNISALKEGCIVDQHETYKNLDVKQYIGHLKKQYEQLFGRSN